MIVKLVVLYPQPTDVEAFEKAYVNEHAPLILEMISGLTRYALSKVIWAIDGKPPFYMMAELYFPSLEALQKGFSPQVAQKMGAHGAVISNGGAPVFFVCTEEIVPCKHTESM